MRLIQFRPRSLRRFALSACLFLLTCVAALMVSAAAIADPAPASPFMNLERSEQTGGDGSANEASDDSLGVMTRLLIMQHQLQQGLNARIRALHQHSGPETAWLLIVASFVYGFVHAAGPGHGKMVIGSYLLSHPGRLRSGLLLSWLAALLQALTAVVLVFGLITIAGMLSRDALASAATAELLSFGLIALLGMALVARAARRLIGTTRQGAATPKPDQHAHAHGHAHQHHHALDAAGNCCGHAHHVVPSDGGRWPMVATVLAVGSRPCTGAVLVLLGTHLLGLWLAGIIAVFAMAVGTALAISLLATLAVHARSLALRLVGQRVGSDRLQAIGDVLALIGGLVILTIGALLVLGAWTSPGPVLVRF